VRANAARTLALCAILSCSSNEAHRTDGSSPDAGPKSEDASAPFDADAAPAVDSGSSADSGSNPSSDSGSGPRSDSGTHPADGSTSAHDSGTVGGMDASMPPPPPPLTCAPPIQPVSTAQPTAVVGSGAGTCTEARLRTAIQGGGVIVFDCGGAATIAVTSELVLPSDRDITIDGGGSIVLDGQGATRILRFDGMGATSSQHTITLQHITLTNGRSTGTPIPSAPAPCAQGFENDGAGGAILVANGILHLIDATFTGNQAPLLGPDVGGGAVYVRASLDLTITASRFSGNAASNGGAVGALFTRLTVVNSTFDGNMAAGNGQNTVDPSCPPQPGTGLREAGSGGDGGAVLIDGSETATDVFCGARFTNNSAGALGGAIFRTPDGQRQTTTIDQTTIDSNTSVGGGALYFHHSTLSITASTLSNNTAMERGGAIQADDTALTLTNDTLAGNVSLTASGGAIALFSSPVATISSSTLANNHADAGAGHFGGAIFSNSAFTIEDTIFSGNTTQDQFSPMTCAIGGGATGSGNVQWPRNHVAGNQPDTACTPGILFADPLLGALGDNTGPTSTMLPAAGSPAIGIGTMCPAQDQRGIARRTPSGCTSGACEVP
jgi:polymorphic membrane protein